MTVTGKEFRIICLALAGKIKDGDDINAAEELNISLLEHRAKNVRNLADQSDKSLELAIKETRQPT